MFQFKLILVLVVFLAFANSQIISEFSSNVTRGLIIPAGTVPELRQTYEVTGTPIPTVTFRVYPCFGEINFFASAGSPPTPTNNGCAQMFTGDDIPFYICSFGQTTLPTNYQLLFTSNRQFPDAVPPQSGTFDLLAANETVDINTVVPTPGGNGLISLDLSNGGRATISFEPTGVPQDSYELYTLEGPLPDGAYLQTGCGVQAVMNLNPNATFNLVDGTVSFNVDNSVATTAVIVVTRENPVGASYFAAYGIATFNNAALVHPTLFLALFAFFFALI